MNINNGWKIKDEISGLSIEAIDGKYLNHLHIESLDGKMNRDFWFTKDGKFDGTGSGCACGGNVSSKEIETNG